MKITFKTITFRNFLSYGNRDSVIDLSIPGMTTLRGVNGSGKSVLEDALSFALYGKPYRKIKLADLVNRVNKKNAWVQVVFQQNVTDYRVTRTLAPASCTIEKKNPNETEWVELEVLSANRIIQEELNKIIGIDFDTFKHIVAIAAAASQSKPFLTLNAGDKRSLIESLFNLEVVSELYKMTRLAKADNRLKLQTSETKVTMYRNLISQIETQIESSLATIEKFSENKDSKIQSLQQQYSVVKGNIETNIKTAERFVPFINKDVMESIANTISNLAKQVGELITKQADKLAVIKHNKKVISKLKTTDICPVCNTTVTDDHRDREIDILSTQIAITESEAVEITNELTNTKAELTVQSSKFDDMKSAKNKFDSLLDQVATYKQQLTQLQQQITLAEAETLNVNVDDLLNTKKQNDELLELNNNILAECLEKDRIFEITDFLLSDGGIKAEFYNVIVPMFNSTVNEYIKKFDLPIAIAFNHDFEYSIHTVQSPDIDVNYYAFSEGEKKRIDISIMLAFIKLSKTIANWSTNVIILDEVLDGGIDNDGLVTMLEHIRDIANSEQLSMFIVTHKLLDNNEFFDRNILITKDDGFSKIISID